MDSTVVKRYRAQVISEIHYGGKERRPGDTIEVVGLDIDRLRQAGVIGAIQRIFDEPEIEMAVTEAPEDTSRNYRRRPR